jgi:ribosomal protein S10
MEKFDLSSMLTINEFSIDPLFTIVEAVKRTGSEIRGPVPLPTKKRRTPFFDLHTSTKIHESSLRFAFIAGIIDIVSATSRNGRHAS